MQTKTLTSPKEILLKSPEGTKLSANVVDRHIAREEMYFARNWLGWEFYQEMLEASLDITTVPEWSDNETYDLDEKVQCYSQLYKSLTASNQGAITDKNSWQKISKFDEHPTFEKLYNYFLLEYISYVVTAQAMEYMNAVTGKGLTEISDDGIKTASLDRMMRRESRTLSLADTIRDNMAYWMLEQKYGQLNTDMDKAYVISKAKKVIKTRSKPRRIALRRLPMQDSQMGHYTIKSKVGATVYSITTFEQTYEDQQTDTLVWTRNGGDLKSLIDSAYVIVTQNGQVIFKDINYTINEVINGNDQLIINTNTHIPGSFYVITAAGTSM